MNRKQIIAYFVAAFLGGTCGNYMPIIPMMLCCITIGVVFGLFVIPSLKDK